MELSEFDYAAMEPIENIIRLVRDKNGNVYIITNHMFEDRYSAPFGIAYASGELYNDRMEVYALSEIEMMWIQSVAPFAKDLEIIQPAE